MAIRTLLKFRNVDLTRDLNDQLSKLITPGVFDGGIVTVVPAQLKVDLNAPWKLINKSGMVVEETSDDSRLDTPAGQTTVIAVKAVYVSNNDPIVEVVAIELSAFNLLADIDDYIVFAHVEVPIAATSVLTSNIQLFPRNLVDKVGRNTLRGVVTSAGVLPDATENIAGDLYVVADGVGGIPHVYGWDGTQWLILTDAATVTSDLATHRANLFTDEQHLTDDEKDAVVGTSGNPVSSTNKLVDNADTRVPTQDENNALVGTDGSPSTTNPYVTGEFPLAVPEEKELSTAPSGTSISILGSEGPVYVGGGGTTSANQYFTFYDQVQPREYTTSTGLKVSVNGVFLDSGLTSEIDPSIDPNVDADGFFNGGTLYISFDVTPDTGLRLLYGKRQTFLTFPIDALLRRTISDGQTSSDAITTVEAIKGRDWDDTPPINEQNINLRARQVDLIEYLAAVFRADHVVGDFDKVEGISEFSGDFVKNVGIPPNYSFENTSSIGFNYTTSTGTVTYNSAVTLVGPVVPGNVFIDGDDNEFEITSVIDNQNITIQKRNGVIPLTINNTITTTAHGSTKPDNNPRKINLSTLEYIIGRERIHTREIEAIPNEFHLATANLAFQIRNPLRSAFFREPRVRFYGGFQNRESGTRSRVECSNTGIITVTGFFTDVRLLVDLKDAGPSLTIKIDGDPTGTVVDTSRAGTVADLGNVNDIQQQSVSIATGLADLVPHHIQIEVTDAVEDFIIWGIDLFRTDTTTVQLLPGRAFVQSELFKKDTPSTFAPPSVATRGRGAVATRYITRALSEATQLDILQDFDGAAGGPAGTAVSGTANFTVTSGLVKFQNYKAGDIVKIVTATDEQVRQIASIGPGVGQTVFTTNVTTSGAAILIHVCSTTGESADPIKEYNRYSMSELGTRQETDFSVLFFAAQNRLFTTEDGTTSVAGVNIQYIATGIDGFDAAIDMIDGTSTLRIRALASQLDIITANTTGVTADFKIDGSPSFSKAIPGGGTTKITGWTNARYQSHELLISNATGMRIAAIIMHEPKNTIKIEGSLLSTQNVIADYDSSTSDDGNVIPAGSVAIDPYSMGGVFVNGGGVGTNWSQTIDFALNPHWGRFIETDKEGSYFEYFFLGSGFELEYIAQNDKGRPRLFLNGTLATLANFPGSTFKGVITGTAEVDMYDPSVTPVRKKFGISGLPYAPYVFRIEVQTPAANNASSTGIFINVGTFYEINDNGRLSVSPAKGFRGKAGIDDFVYGLDWARDERNFDSGAIAKEEVPVLRTLVEREARSQRVALASGSSFVDVTFTDAFADTDYSVTATLVNTVDTNPEYRPVTITNIVQGGFRASWNDTLDTANYSLHYVAIKFI